MFAINQIRDRVSSSVKYLTTSACDQPGYYDPEIASRNAGLVDLALGILEGSVRTQYPHRRDVLVLRKKLAEESGGTGPADLLHVWSYTWTNGNYDEKQKQAMSRLCRKWLDKDRIRNEFCGLVVMFDEELDLKWRPPGVLTREHLEEVVNWAREWLAAKRKTIKLD